MILHITTSYSLKMSLNFFIINGRAINRNSVNNFSCDRHSCSMKNGGMPETWRAGTQEYEDAKTYHEFLQRKHQDQVFRYRGITSQPKVQPKVQPQDQAKAQPKFRKNRSK